MTRSGDQHLETKELRSDLAEKEAAEAHRAREALSEQEADQHARRAEKSAYLREKLAERAQSEREQ